MVASYGTLPYVVTLIKLTVLFWGAKTDIKLCSITIVSFGGTEFYVMI